MRMLLILMINMKTMIRMLVLLTKMIMILRMLLLLTMHQCPMPKILR